MKYYGLRPEQGWPALFRAWEKGDSMPVVGTADYVLRCIHGYFNNDATKISRFKVQPIAGTNLSRVTRVS